MQLSEALASPALTVAAALVALRTRLNVHPLLLSLAYALDMTALATTTLGGDQQVRPHLDFEFSR